MITRKNRRDGLTAFIGKPLGVAGAATLLVIVIACALARWIAPYAPLDQDLLAATQMPSSAHWLGTDTLGRDVLSRLLFGGQSALAGIAQAVTVFTVLGVVFGVLAGFTTQRADLAISAAVDMLMSLPSIVVTLAVLALFDNSLSAAMVTLGLFSAGGLVRVVRAVTKVTREELYVDAARVSGLGHVRIMTRHILPRLAGPVVIQVSLFAGIALVVQSGLGFLNLGVTAPAPSWGGMVGEASQVIEQFPWLLLPSGGIISITILALGLIGDAVRDVNAETTSRSRGLRLVERPSRKATRTLSALVAGRPLLSVKGLQVSFASRQAETIVVKGISFDVAAGEIVGLVGESGSGKSASALSILGLLPDNARIEAEHIRFDNVELIGATHREFRTLRGKGIGLVSQEPMVALDPSFTIGNQLAEIVGIGTRMSRRERLARAEQLLRDVRIPAPAQILKRYAHELSGGLAQRVVIAMALARNPKLIIADEPTTALDVTVQAEILDLLRQLRAQRNMAILMVTHNLGVVADICDRVLVMQDGIIVEQQGVEPLFAAPQHAYTRKLMEATPNLLDPGKNPGKNSGKKRPAASPAGSTAKVAAR
jgi:peptide/nickel transport system permease protein